MLIRGAHVKEGLHALSSGAQESFLKCRVPGCRTRRAYQRGDRIRPVLLAGAEKASDVLAARRETARHNRKALAH
jgi:hypothetical protein